MESSKGNLECAAEYPGEAAEKLAGTRWRRKNRAHQPRESVEKSMAFIISGGRAGAAGIKRQRWKAARNASATFPRGTRSGDHEGKPGEASEQRKRPFLRPSRDSRKRISRRRTQSAGARVKSWQFSKKLGEKAALGTGGWN